MVHSRHEIKRCLLLGRKAMININSVFKNSDITLLTKVNIVKAMVFPVVMCGCEIFIGRTDVEAEAAILWPPDAAS